MSVGTSDGEHFDSMFEHQRDYIASQQDDPVTQGIEQTDNEGYDMQGALAAGEKPDARGHMTDKYKTPSHITFSNESIYHGKDGEQGGEWGHTDDGKDTFTPGPTNFKYHSMNEMQKYFDKYEPEAKLISPFKMTKLDESTEGHNDTNKDIDAFKNRMELSRDRQKILDLLGIKRDAIKPLSPENEWAPSDSGTGEPGGGLNWMRRTSNDPPKAANDNRDLRIPDDPYVHAIIDQQWNKMVKEGKKPNLKLVPK